jgi:hypothetical protein
LCTSGCFLLHVERYAVAMGRCCCMLLALMQVLSACLAGSHVDRALWWPSFVPAPRVLYAAAAVKG